MTLTVTEVSSIPPLERAEATELGRVAYERFVDAADSLTSERWAGQTDCAAWTVRDLTGHVAGMMATMSSLRAQATEQLQAHRRAKREGIDAVDAMTAIQVEAMRDRTTTALVDEMRSLIAPAIAGRRRLPEAIARRATFPQQVNGAVEKWSFSYLLGTIVTRDTWLHRVADLARAVDVQPVLDAAHDGRIVADVVAEWCRRHGQPVELVLTGPCGGRFHHGTGGPTIEVDAVEFCRMLSGRAEPAHPLLSTQVPF